MSSVSPSPSLALIRASTVGGSPAFAPHLRKVVPDAQTERAALLHEAILMENTSRKRCRLTSLLRRGATRCERPERTSHLLVRAGLVLSIDAVPRLHTSVGFGIGIGLEDDALEEMAQL